MLSGGLVVHNDPVNATDPTGMQMESAFDHMAYCPVGGCQTADDLASAQRTANEVHVETMKALGNGVMNNLNSAAEMVEIANPLSGAMEALTGLDASPDVPHLFELQDPSVQPYADAMVSVAGASTGGLGGAARLADDGLKLVGPGRDFVAVGRGRIAGVVLRNRDFMVRLDVDRIPGSQGAVLHLNIGRTGRGQSMHIPLHPYARR